jgi:photoactive yellow protein
MERSMDVTFESENLPTVVETFQSGEFDELPFGLIVMDRLANVIWYNTYESKRAGLDPAKVLGRNFFEVVAPCTNNYLIAQRYTDDQTLDEALDFVFTLRMAPTPVRLRMMATAGSSRQYLAVKSR